MAVGHAHQQQAVAEGWHLVAPDQLFGHVIGQAAVGAQRQPAVGQKLGLLPGRLADPVADALADGVVVGKVDAGVQARGTGLLHRVGEGRVGQLGRHLGHAALDPAEVGRDHGGIAETVAAGEGLQHGGTGR